MSKNNDFWLGKIRLWFALRGGVKAWFEQHRESELCENCRFWQKTNQAWLPLTNTGYTDLEWVSECKRKKEFRGKLMVNPALTDIQFLQQGASAYPFYYICAEWIKNV